MAKRRQSLRIRIPLYHPPRNNWKMSIHNELMKKILTHSVQYIKSERLELKIILYLPPNKIGWHDVDNRLKDIMDALQGRAGGPKAKRFLKPVIPNDSQIYKVTIEKKTPPGQSHGLGHLIIRKYKQNKKN